MTQDKLSEELSAYELQVLIGTSISGCNMPPSTIFDLKAAWSRLFTLGLIDRVDGLAIATKAGTERIRELLALRSALTTPPAREISEAEVERVRSVIRYINHPETPWSDDQIKAVIEAARSPS